MKILELDAGNTRIKWRLLDTAREGGAVGSGFAVADRLDLPAELEEQLQALEPQELEQVRVGSVRGERFQQAFSAFVEDRFSLQPAFAKVRPFCAGVHNGYRQFDSMGVDRWLAMLAAWQRAGGACCVVDMGSAITVDVIDAQGWHQGGYIVPGIHLMQTALAEKSSALPYNPAYAPSIELGKSTEEAITHGILNMCLGLLAQIPLPLRQKDSGDRGNEVQWFLTGGDGPLISGKLAWPHALVPDLVLDGLALALATEEGR